MIPDNVDAISAIYCAVVVLAVLKGLFGGFDGDKMYSILIGLLNLAASLLSLGLSIYGVLQAGNRSSIFYILNPFEILIETNIIALLLVTALLYIFFSFALKIILSVLRIPLKAVSRLLSAIIRRIGGFWRSLIGGVLSLAGAGILLIVVTAFIGVCGYYFPANKLSAAAKKSGAVSFVNSYGVLPIVERIGGGSTSFLKDYAEAFSKSVSGSPVLNDRDALRNISNLRFQLETKSNGEIDAEAKRIVGREKDERKKAYLLYKWIGANISYDWNKYDDVNDGLQYLDRFGAIPTFSTRKGICEDYADLYAAMAKSVGLKVRVIAGQGLAGGQWGGHAWNEVYIPREKRWINVDPTWAKAGNYFDNRNFADSHKTEAVAGEW